MKINLVFYLFIFFLFFIRSSSSQLMPLIDFESAEANEHLSGGMGTVFSSNKNSFSLPMRNIHPSNKIDFFIGNGLFQRNWVASPSLTEASDGLGPLFSGNSCQSCHISDGRGHPPLTFTNDSSSLMTLHLSIPSKNELMNTKYDSLKIKLNPEPIYGSQLSSFGIEGIYSEGNIDIVYEFIPIAFNNGKIISLRKPIYSIVNKNYGDLHIDVQISARVAQPMIGLGLIENISEIDILNNVDLEDLNKDGITGKANYVWDIRQDKSTLGRFGWKASQPSIYQQTVDALFEDMGLSSTAIPLYDNCTHHQLECKKLPNGNSKNYDDVEVSNDQVDLIVYYSKHLGVPQRRDYENARVLEGKEIFFKSGCASCHTPKFVTMKVENDQSLSEQVIWPYSDFLLHDMGEDLADDVDEFLANGGEWRTPPLWGVGLTSKVSGHTNLLHDGRARNILEAILWHGGESKKSKENVLNLSDYEIENLLLFINSL